MLQWYVVLGGGSEDTQREKNYAYEYLKLAPYLVYIVPTVMALPRDPMSLECSHEPTPSALTETVLLSRNC